MSNIYDYLKWRGDLSMRIDPFNDIDGLILSELVYVDFDKPRKLLVDLIGEENQSLPVLVFADGQNFINDVDGILAEFAMTNGCPAKHP